MQAYQEFSQDSHFCVKTEDKEELPVLSPETLEQLAAARHNVSMMDGWLNCYNYRVKIALVKEHLSHTVIRAESNQDCKAVREAKERLPFAKQALNFLEYYVHDVYPFRDHVPENVTHFV